MAKRGTKTAADLPAAEPARRDRGVTFIELLVAIVLLGTVVVATVTALHASIVASRVDRDHANAHAWLQSATDVLYGVSRADCGDLGTPDAAAVLATYQTVVRAVPNPEAWPASQISISEVAFWDGSSFGTNCFDDVAKTLQRIRLRVVGTDGLTLEDVEIVKGGSVANGD
jgi:prepilin-type N-terminal cleavage/methylation domain-containing protein